MEETITVKGLVIIANCFANLIILFSYLKNSKKIEKLERYSYYPYNRKPVDLHTYLSVYGNITIKELIEKNEDYGGSDGNFKC